MVLFCFFELVNEARYSNIKVLHIVAGNINGGAARGAYWLHRGLLENNVKSKILTNSRVDIDDNSVISICRTPFDRLKYCIWKKLESLLLLFFPKKLNSAFSTGLFGFNLIKHKEFIEADIIHLHWINDCFINMKLLSTINKPIVWTLRDMWPFTGGCHVAESIGCDNYKYGCGSCKSLGSNKSNDLSKFIIRNKVKYFPKKMKIIGISNWITRKALDSYIFKNFSVQTIPNNIDIKFFTNFSKSSSKKKLGINTQKKIICCGASSLNDKWKGFDLFIKCLFLLDSKKYFIILFGTVDSKIIKNLKFEYKNFGFVQNNNFLNNIYSASDVFVAPSYVESFGKTIAESMLCGTPAVCFDATGSRDIISHKKDGYVARSFEPNDLASGIQWVCNICDYKKISSEAEKKIKSNYSSLDISRKYIDLYKGLI